MSDESRTERTAPGQCLVDHRLELATRREIETFERVDRSEDLLHRTALRVEIELDLLTHSDHTMSAESEPVSIDLVPMS